MAKLYAKTSATLTPALPALPSKPHTYQVGGQVVPSVTTIIAGLGWNKEGLIAWAARAASNGENPLETRARAAWIGLATHQMIEAFVKGQPLTVEHTPPTIMESCMSCFASFQAWWKEHDVRPLGVETSLVSGAHLYGGTIDLVAEVDGIITVCDFKTSDDIAKPEYRLQLAAYQHLWNAAHDQATQAGIVGLRKDGKPARWVRYADLTDQFRAFLLLRELHNLKNKV